MMQMNGHTKRSTWKIKLALLAAAALFGAAGCSVSNDSDTVKPDIQVVDEGSAIEEKVDKKALLEKFQLIVTNAKDASDVIAFLDANIEKADQTTADTMLRGLHDYYDAHLEAAQNAFFTSNVQEVLLKEAWPITEDSALAIKEETVRTLVQNAYKGGYKLETVEGSIYPVVDYSVQAHYGKSVSEQMNAYIRLMAEGSDKAAAKDGGLTITWDELAARALLTEAFVTKYKDSPEREAVQDEYVNKYMSMYINGLVNTPIYDTKTFKLLDEVKASYKKTVAEAPDSVTGRLVAQFLDVLAESGDQVIAVKDGEQAELAPIKQFREGLWAEAEKLLK
jgi:hypothetical protein